DLNAIASSFAHDVSVAAVLLEPAGGVAGNFPNQDIAASAFAGGVASVANFRYDEVGVVTLTATSSDYLGHADADISGFSRPVGRFIPHHFTVTPVTNACGAFTYSGQPFTATVTAYNALGAITQNYAGSQAFDVYFSDASSSIAGAFVPGSNGIAAADFAAGSATSSAVVFAFDDIATAEATLTLHASNADGVSSAGHAQASALIRGGRLRVLDHAASSLTSAQVAFLAEYWSGAAWDSNVDDNCTALSAASFSLGPYSGGLAAGAASVTGVAFGDGIGRVMLAPT